jgi:hypothetical protein
MTTRSAEAVASPARSRASSRAASSITSSARVSRVGGTIEGRLARSRAYTETWAKAIKFAGVKVY